MVFFFFKFTNFLQRIYNLQEEEKTLSETLVLCLLRFVITDHEVSPRMFLFWIGSPLRGGFQRVL